MHYAGGSVKLLNNGYESRPNIVLSGFLAFDGVYFLRIANVSFRYCYIEVGAHVTTTSSALLSLNRFRQVEIRSCNFSAILADTSALLYVDSYLTMPIVPLNGIEQEHALLHLVISNCTVQNLASQSGALIQIEFHYDHQNVRLYTRPRTCYSVAGTISIMNDDLVASATNGKYISVNGVTVFQPPTGVIVSGLDVRSSLGTYMLQILNIGNVELTALSLIGNGESKSGTTSYGYVLELLKNYQNSYLSIMPVVENQITCTGVASVTNILNLSIKYSVFSENYCPHGSPGVILSGKTNDIFVDSNNFTNNVGFGGITLSVEKNTQLSDILCQNNSNLLTKDSVCLNINMNVPCDVVVADSQFVDNSGLFCTVMFVRNTKSLTLRNVLLQGNKAEFTVSGVGFNPSDRPVSAFHRK